MRSRFLFLLMTLFSLLFFPALAFAQGITAGVEARMPMTRMILDFHDGQWGTTQSLTGVEISALASQRGLFSFKYSVTGGTSGEDTLTNPSLFIVGSTDFSQKQSSQPGAQGAQTEKTIALSWRVPVSHRVECSLGSYAFRPFIVGNALSFTVEATGENKDGKVVTDTETAKRFAWGIGGAYAVPVTRQAVGMGKVAFGRGYQFVEVSIVGRLYPDMAIEAGYLHQRAKWEGFSMTVNAPFIGVIAAF